MVQIISGAEKGKTGKITTVMLSCCHAHQLYAGSHMLLTQDCCFLHADHNKDRANCCRRCKSQGLTLHFWLKLMLFVTQHHKLTGLHVHLQTRHNKPKAEGESGQISENESPIHHSNVMLYSQDQKVRSKVGIRYAVVCMLCIMIVVQFMIMRVLLSPYIYRSTHDMTLQRRERQEGAIPEEDRRGAVTHATREEDLRVISYTCLGITYRAEVIASILSPLLFWTKPCSTDPKSPSCTYTCG